MLNLFFENPLAFFIIFPALLMSITLHEYAHCLAADYLGDPTPRSKGRLILNPMAHLDPMGLIAMLLTRFGWGKPAPYDPYNLKDPVRDSALIALAGPMINLIIALVLAFFVNINISSLAFFQIALFQIMVMNIVLAIFNLIPIYPLDGSKILTAILPKKASQEFQSLMQRFGTIFLLLLIFPTVHGESPLSMLISPIINIIIKLLTPLYY